MKTAAVICHARYLDLAAFDEPLRACGYHVRYYDAGYDSVWIRSTPISSPCFQSTIHQKARDTSVSVGVRMDPDKPMGHLSSLHDWVIRCSPSLQTRSDSAILPPH
jgi:hypothetical protein